MTAFEEIEVVAILLGCVHIALGFVATVAVSTNRRPSAAIAWVLAIVFIPYLGAIAYFFVGRDRLPARRREQQRMYLDLLTARSPGVAELDDHAVWPPWLASLVRMNTALGALPMTTGNSIRLLEDYVGSIEAMIAAIDRAERFVNVEFYILVLDDTTRPFFDALARACARGVTVRVLSDHLSGFLYPNRRETQDALRAMGARWYAMLPLRPLRGQWQRPDLRNHRKLVVVDGVVGFTGSQNLIAASYLKKKNVARGLHWVELMAELHGAAVRELDAVFAGDWLSESGELLGLDEETAAVEPGAASVDVQVLPSGPSFDNDNNLKLFTALIHKAERRISITSPYFVPDESVQLALITAAARGLEIELFVSEIGDQKLVYHAQRSYYEALLRAGISIRLYAAPAVLHSKHFTIDEDVAVIGSSNMDIRSFSLNMEVSLLVAGRSAVDELRAVEDRYRARSRTLTLNQWQQRPWGEKTWDALARLTSSLQ